jgi:hypothetical protein
MASLTVSVVWTLYNSRINNQLHQNLDFSLLTSAYKHQWKVTGVVLCCLFVVPFTVKGPKGLVIASFPRCWLCACNVTIISHYVNYHSLVFGWWLQWLKRPIFCVPHILLGPGTWKSPITHLRVSTMSSCSKQPVVKLFDTGCLT